MRRSGAADGLVGNTDVGDLRGHADHERGIHKVPVIGVIVLVPAWKLQASRFRRCCNTRGSLQPQHRGLGDGR